jgi:hypothetical protein
MFRPASDYPDDVTVYLVVNDFGKFGRAFVEIPSCSSTGT